MLKLELDATNTYLHYLINLLIYIFVIIDYSFRQKNIVKQNHKTTNY